MPFSFLYPCCTLLILLDDCRLRRVCTTRDVLTFRPGQRRQDDAAAHAEGRPDGPARAHPSPHLRGALHRQVVDNPPNK